MSDKDTNRDNRMVFLLNKEEKDFMDSYLRKYKIQNRSRWMRETLMQFILKNLDKDYPTLFDEQDMRR